MEKLSIRTARRIALAAQGFGAQQPQSVNQGHLRRTLDTVALHQIDSVNVLARAHYLPAFSRIGAYDRGLLDEAAWGPRRKRRMFEYWAHEASLLPLELHPLLRWRMTRADSGVSGWKSMRAYATERRAEAMAVLQRIRGEGPLAASDFENGKGAGGWWTWSEAKRALEWLFWAGHVTTATRRGSFERVYDLPERVLPAETLALPTPTPADAQTTLVERSARALGLGTASDLRDYFRLSLEESRAAISRLLETGALREVQVDGWRAPAYLHSGARRPRSIKGQALLVPFDPLIWERSRTERLFGFRYRVEIYTPAERRVHGYYVLPFLMDEALTARVDLKADRERSALLARKITLEPDAPSDTAERLSGELRRMADWLGLERVVQ